MMTPRLRMNSPCTYNLDAARSVNVSSYMDRLGFFSDMSQAWKNYVRRMYDEFDASIAVTTLLHDICKADVYFIKPDGTPSASTMSMKRIFTLH